MRSFLKSVLPTEALKSLRTIRHVTRDLPGRLFRNPRLECYMLLKGWQNHRMFLRDKRLGAERAALNRLDPFKRPELPKIIWMFWGQGEANAPFIVRRCIESWRNRNPGWEVRVLDDTTVADYVDMSDFPTHLDLPGRFPANLLRVRLMSSFGGVWADATVYCHRPLDSWIDAQILSGFFAFRQPEPNAWLESWFLISCKGHVIPTAWNKSYTSYLKNITSLPWVYFVFSYVLQWQTKRDPKLRAAWQRCAVLPAQPTFFMMEALRGTLPVDRTIDMVSSGTPVSKLSWKEDVSETDFDAICRALESK